MLQRASEGEDKDLCEMCLATGIGADKCEAVCGNSDEDNTDNEDKIVRSGDLAVTASASSTKKIILGAASDTDTLKFKTSEDVEISKITLERFGYSSRDSIESVRLEDEDGTVIADAKSVNSKDQVVLTIKKDYRNVDGTFNATIVVETSTWAKVGETIGFKIIDAESTAKNLNLDDYDPYTYELVKYDGSTVEITHRDNGKDYNYEAGKSYEIAKFKVKAGDNAVTVNGFTLTNKSTVVTGTNGMLDVKDFLDDVKVYANGEAVKSKFSLNRDDELVINLSNEYEIASKEKVTFSVEISMKGLDEYNKYVNYVIDEEANFNAVEKKTWARVKPTGLAGTWSTYVFLGGKVKITNTRLGNIDAAQWAEDVLVAEWSITVPEALDKVSFTLNGTSGANAVDGMTMVVNGEEFDGKITYNANNTISVAFSNVDIEKSGKVKFLIDVKDDEKFLGNKFSFSTFNKNTISSARYADSRESALSEIAGSISFGDITIQGAKWSLENDKSDETVQFIGNETNRKVIFEGKVSARKADFNLKSFIVTGTDSYKVDDFTFYLFLDGEEVANADLGEDQSFSNVLVKAGESVNVKVEAEVDAAEAASSRYYRDFSLLLDGEDMNNVDITTLQEPCAELKVVSKGQVKVEGDNKSDTVLLKGKNKSIATFVIKPDSKADDETLVLENITLQVIANKGTANEKYLTGDDLRVKVDNVEEKDYSTTGFNSHDAIRYELSTDVKSAGITVEVIAKGEYNSVEVSIVNANDRGVTKTASKAFEDVLVWVDSQENNNVETKWYFWVSKSDSDYVVSNVRLYTGSYDGTNTVVDPTKWISIKQWGEIVNGDYDSIMDMAKDRSDEYITAIYYEIGNSAGGYCNGASSITTKAECEDHHGELWTCVTTANATPTYACPDTYYAAAPIDDTTTCDKLVIAEGSATVVTYIGGIAYAVDNTDTTGSVATYECADAKAVLDGTTCTKTETNVDKTVNACDQAGQTWTKTADAKTAAWTWTTSTQPVTIYKSQFNDYFKVGSSYATHFAKS